MNDSLLYMKDINKSFGNIKVLKNVSLRLNSGSILALMGENGAGKSTLMNILSGSLLADNGEIFINGKKQAINDPITAKLNGISKIHQELQLVNEMSVAENIFMGRWSTKYGLIDFKKMEKEAVKYLEMLDIKVKPETKMKDLRIGEQQLVEIAKALSLDSNIIIMDEPTSSISAKETEKLFEIIKKLKSENKGIIYISHRMEEIFEISDKIMVLRDGEYIASHDTSSTSSDEIIRLMVGRSLDKQYPKDETTKGENALEVIDLSYSPPKNSFKRSLKGISLSVKHGEVLGIAGLAGSGRTEFFECISGMHKKYTSGKILIDEREVSIKKPADAIKCGISFATEDRKGTGLVLLRPILENITLPLLKQFSRFSFMKEKEEKEVCISQMKALKVKAYSEKVLVGSLSGGNQQKVVLAKWLLAKPKILLLDEPTRGIDVGAKAEIYQLINDLAKQGIAIIVISSELPEIIGIADRIVTFCEGVKTGEFSREEATQETLLTSATK